MQSSLPWASCAGLQFRRISLTQRGELLEGRGGRGSSRATGAPGVAGRAPGGGDLKSSLSSGSGQLYHQGEEVYQKGPTFCGPLAGETLSWTWEGHVCVHTQGLGECKYCLLIDPREWKYRV